MRAIWTDAPTRRTALQEMIAAWHAGRPDLDDRTRRVDDAVVAGLAALELPRGPIRAIRIAPDIRGWRGRKTSECDLLLSGHAIQRLLEQDRTDLVLRVWIHESIHAPQPFAPSYHSEYRHAPGYEEGMVELLTRSVLAEAGIESEDTLLDYFVMGYAVLASSIGIDIGDLVRVLWRCAPGTVRATFADIIQSLMSHESGSQLSMQQATLLQGVADRMFGAGRVGYTPDEGVILQMRELALR